MRKTADRPRSAVRARRGAGARRREPHGLSRSHGRRAALRLGDRAGGDGSAQGARRLRSLRSAHASRCAAMVDEEHLPPLAEGKSLLIWHSRRRFCSNCGGDDAFGRRRLAARLPDLQDAALPAHRSGRDHAGDRRRALPARPLRPLRRQFLVVPGGLRRARRDHRRRGAARSPRGSRHRLRTGEIFPLAAVAVSLLADDRLPCAGAVARARRSITTSSRARAGSTARRSRRCWRGSTRRD